MPSCGQHNSLASPWPFGVVQLEQNPVTSPWPFGMVNAAEVLWPAGVGASCSKRVQPEQHSLPAKEAKRARTISTEERACMDIEPATAMPMMGGHPLVDGMEMEMDALPTPEPMCSSHISRSQSQCYQHRLIAALK